MNIQKIADGETLLSALDEYAMKHGESLPVKTANSFYELRSYLMNEQTEFVLAYGRELLCKR